MTVVQARVDAAAVTLEELPALAPDTLLVWDGVAATHGRMFSPLERQAWPDTVALVDRAAGVLTVQLIDYVDDAAWPTVRGALPGTYGTVADVLARAGERSGGRPVVQFATGPELDVAGEQTVPAIAVWTGPVIAAWEVPISGPRQELCGSRIGWQGSLSRRVTSDDEMDWEASDGVELLAADDGTGRWTLSVAGRTVAELPDAPAHRTLADVLAWMTAQMHTLLERAPFEPMPARPFAVNDTDGPDRRLLVRMW